jgi:hypothetical protein
MLATSAFLPESSLHHIPSLNDPSSKSVKEFSELLQRFQRKHLRANGAMTTEARNATQLINLIDPDMLATVFTVDPYFIALKANDVNLVPTALTEAQLQGWIADKVAAYVVLASQPTQWKADLDRIYTRLDIKVSASDNLLPAIVAFDKYAKNHHMEQLLLTSTKYQKEQYQAFLDSISPQACAEYIKNKTEEDVAYVQGAHKQFKPWLAASAIPYCSEWLRIMTHTVFATLISEEKLKRDKLKTVDVGEKRKRVEEVPAKAEEVRALKAKLKTAEAKVRKLEGSSAVTPMRKKPICFNCNLEGHKVEECSKPLLQSRIDSNKKQFFDRIASAKVVHPVPTHAPSDLVTSDFVMADSLLPPHVARGGTWSTNLQTGQMVYNMPRNRVVTVKHATTVHFDPSLQPDGWTIQVGQTSCPYLQTGIADTGAQLVIAGSNTAQHLVSQGEELIPLTDFEVGMLTPDHVAKALGMFITDLQIRNPTGGTVTFKRQQVIIIEGTDEILLSDWCIDRMGIKLYDLMSAVMATHPVFEGNANAPAPVRDTTAKRVRIRPTRPKRNLRQLYAVDFLGAEAEDEVRNIPDVPTGRTGAAEYFSDEDYHRKRARTLRSNSSLLPTPDKETNSVSKLDSNKFPESRESSNPSVGCEDPTISEDLHQALPDQGDSDSEEKAPQTFPSSTLAMFTSVTNMLQSSGVERALTRDPLHLSPADVETVQQA